MPMYEYYCEACEGVFELLRPVREAGLDQPCPSCDEDARRIVSKEWSAFIFREGAARRLPDDGSYRHLGKKVSKPITGPSDGFTHPELTPPESKIVPPSLEEIERWEHKQAQRREAQAASGVNMVNVEHEREKATFANRLLKTRGTKKVQQAKSRLVQTGIEEARRVQAEQAKKASGVPHNRKKTTG